MVQQTSPGTCSLCKVALDKKAMAKHLDVCERRVAPQRGATGPRRLLHLRVEGAHIPEYWLDVEVPADATLGDLDRFLRRTWLECCGHMSMFAIDHERYQTPGDPEGESRPLSVELGDVLRPRQRFRYEYDFGSTTELVLKVVAVRAGGFKGQVPRLLARNDPPRHACGSCGRPATLVCTQCSCRAEDTGWLCEACGEKHECGEGMLLPAVNSPRVGVCGYVG